MEFNFQRIFKSLLFSSSKSLTIKDFQDIITRYHNLPSTLKKEMLLGGIVEGESTENIVNQVPVLIYFLVFNFGGYHPIYRSLISVEFQFSLKCQI